jgi:isopentenyl-diphosphate delta-isomerase
MKSLSQYQISLLLIGWAMTFSHVTAFQVTPSAQQRHRSTILTASAISTEYGANMDQEAMMESDTLITVNSQDVLVENGPSVSKKQAHSFSEDQPRGVCHRAFSLFIFNPEGKLLLTQRAASKITFPSVWTNTACSHPLVGMVPDEVDVVPAAYPQFDGIKHAAIRKAKHELGVTSMKHSDMEFVSRFHYWASDTLTHGPDAPWGEHEVDYILFCQMEEPSELSLDPEEVVDYKYVTIDELKAMMQDPSLSWSPWFLGIMERGGFAWWEDLEASLAGENTNSDVTFFDPTPEHYANYNLPTHTRETGVMS